MNAATSISSRHWPPSNPRQPDSSLAVSRIVVVI
jgi:hypothetical protein